MKLTAFELGQRELPIVGKQHKRGTLYAAIRDYPGRVVSVTTAYNRFVRDASMTLDKACTTRRIKPPTRKPIPLAERYPPEYIADIKTDACYKTLARKWDVHPSTINKHRKELKETRRDHHRA